MATKKMGRPTENPKPYRFAVRVTETQKQLLDKYCKENNCNYMQAIRDGIDMLEAKKK